MCAQLKMKEESKSNTLNLEKYPHIQGSELFKILKCLPRLGRGGPWVAGGSVWRTVNNEMLKDCDVDIYFPNAISYEQSYRQMSSYPFVNNVLSEKKNKWNTTFQIHVNEGKYDKTIDVQFIGMSYHSKLEKLLNSFDFPVCQFGYDGKDIFMGSKSLADLEKRQLSIHRIDYPKTAFKHMLKYLNNGFVVPPDELKRLVKYVLEMDCWSKSASGKYNNDDGQLKEVMEDYIMAQPMPTTNAAWVTNTGYVVQQDVAAPVVWEEATITPAATQRTWVEEVTAPVRRNRNVVYGGQHVNINTAPQPDTNFGNFGTPMDTNNPNLGYGYVNREPNTVPQPDRNPTPVVQEQIGMDVRPPFNGVDTMIDRPREVNNRVTYYDAMRDLPPTETPAVEEENNAVAHRILRRLRDMGGVRCNEGALNETGDVRQVRPTPADDTTTEWEVYEYHQPERN